MSHEKTAAELAQVKVQRDNAVTNSQAASRGTQRVKNEFLKVKQERDEAKKSLEIAREDRDCTSASLYLITNELARAEGERDQARTERDRARGQATTQQGTAAQMLAKVNQEFANKYNQVVTENAALRKAKEERERSVYDLQFIILNNAENRQQLLEYGGANFPAQ